MKMLIEGNYPHADCFNPMNYLTLDRSDVIMNYDLWRLRNSDLVIVNFNDPKSIGTACEIAVAYELRIPIMAYIPWEPEKIMLDLHPWLLNMCSKTFRCLDTLYQYVAERYLE